MDKLRALSKRVFPAFQLVFTMVGLTVTAQAREVVDAAGVKVQVVDHPVRVVTLAPSLGEIAAELVGDHLERIVGVSEYTDYPPVLSKIRSVGPYSRIHLETIAGLKPDLVLGTAEGDVKDQIAHLRELGLPVVVVKSESFQEIDDSIRILGQALDTHKRSEQIRSRLRKGIEKIEKRAAARKKAGVPAPRVLLELDSNPLVVVGKSSFLNEALAKIGAINVYADALNAYPRPSFEDAIHRDPDAVLILGMEKNMAPFEKAVKNWQNFRGMKAVKAGKVKALPGDTILRPAQRILEGLSLLERALYGPQT